MAKSLGMSRVVVPPSAGLFSSFGLLYADVEHHYSRTFRRLLRQADLAEIERAWKALADQAEAQLAAEDFGPDRMRLRRSAALHYQGQSYELTVPVPDGAIDPRMVEHLEEAFGQEHEKTYGHRAGKDEPVELVSIQIVGPGPAAGLGDPERLKPSRAEPQPPPPRRAYFGDAGWIETPILRRSDLSGERRGPFIVEEYDATCVVPPRRHGQPGCGRQRRHRPRLTRYANTVGEGVENGKNRLKCKRANVFGFPR
jgi:N-methylhydantoinase A